MNFSSFLAPFDQTPCAAVPIFCNLTGTSLLIFLDFSPLPSAELYPISCSQFLQQYSLIYHF